MPPRPITGSKRRQNKILSSRNAFLTIRMYVCTCRHASAVVTKCFKGGKVKVKEIRGASLAGYKCSKGHDNYQGG